MQLHRSLPSLDLPLFEVYRMKYRCSECRQETIIPTSTLMAAGSVTILLVVWLILRFLAGDLQGADGVIDDRAVTMVGAPVLMIICVQMVLNGLINRLRFPVIKNPGSHESSSEYSPREC